MPLKFYSCVNCGFWQEYFAAPPSCPVCTDVRNALPADGWNFVSADEMRERERRGAVECLRREIARGVWMFSNRPQHGIGSSGYLIERAGGNIAFEAAGWYSAEAIEFIEARGGIAFLSSSHPHGFGALWQLQRAFPSAIVGFQREAVQFTKAFEVNYVFDDETQIDETATLYHVGGHYEGQTVLYYAPEKMLFAGDSLKFDLDARGTAVAVSCHKAFHKQIPLSRREVEKYREVLGKLDFQQVCTPFEHAPQATTADALRLFDELLNAARITAAPVQLKDVLQSKSVSGGSETD